MISRDQTSLILVQGASLIDAIIIISLIISYQPIPAYTHSQEQITPSNFNTTRQEQIASYTCIVTLFPKNNPSLPSNITEAGDLTTFN